MVKKYVIEGVVALLLMILVLVGHMIEVKLEKEEKEYIDLKLQKHKTSFYNTIRDILMNIFMFLVFMCGKMYFNTDAILVFFPSFLLLFYYSNRRAGSNGVYVSMITSSNVEYKDGKYMATVDITYSTRASGLIGSEKDTGRITYTKDIDNDILFESFIVNK